MDQIVGDNSLKKVAAAVVLSAPAATPVLAQAAIQEPGAFAFYYPYRDVLNGGAPTPAAKLASEPPAAMQAYVARGKWHRRCADAASSSLRAGMAGTLKGRSRRDDDLSGAGAGSHSRIAPRSSLSLWSARSANARSHSPQSGDN